MPETESCGSRYPCGATDLYPTLLCEWFAPKALRRARFALMTTILFSGLHTGLRESPF